MIRALFLAFLLIYGGRSFAACVGSEQYACGCSYASCAGKYDQLQLDDNVCSVRYWERPNIGGEGYVEVWYIPGPKPAPPKCTAGFDWGRRDWDVPIANLNSPWPGSVCSPGGCVVTLTDPGSGIKSCKDATHCTASFPAKGTETAQQCNPDQGPIPEGPVTPPADPVKDGSPPTPLDPERPPPGCANLTDPGCGPVRETPPGCTRTTSSTVTGGVREVITCAQSKCTSEACRTTTTTTTNDWGSKDPWKTGAAPDSSTKETREVDQPKNPKPGTSPTPSTGPVVGSGPGNGKKCVPTAEKPCPAEGGNGDSFCEQNPNSALCDQKDQSGCNDASDSVGCMKPGKLEEKPLIEQERNLVIAKHGDYGPSTSACPAPTSFEAGGRTIQVPFDLICEFADMIRPLVIGFAWLSAALTFFGFARKG